MLCASFLMIAPAAKADADFSLGIGYSHLWLDGSEHFAQRDGVRFEPRFSFGLSDAIPQLRLGAGLGISGYTHQLDRDAFITVNDGQDSFFIRAEQWESISLLEPELQISWRQPLDRRGFGDHDGWYIEPGVGIGAAVANFSINTDWWWDSSRDNEWDTAFEARPFVRAGYQAGRWLLGIEVSYMMGGNLGLTDQIHGQIQELFAGAQFGFRW
jgi:hypothetical protein